MESEGKGEEGKRKITEERRGEETVRKESRIGERREGRRKKK